MFIGETELRATGIPDLRLSFGLDFGWLVTDLIGSLLEICGLSVGLAASLSDCPFSVVVLTGSGILLAFSTTGESVGVPFAVFAIVFGEGRSSFFGRSDLSACTFVASCGSLREGRASTSVLAPFDGHSSGVFSSSSKLSDLLDLKANK